MKLKFTKWFSVNDLPNLIFLEVEFIKFVSLKGK